jgi:hypothetical protein
MCHSSAIKPAVAELLLGHSLGLGDSYLRFTEEEILQEYNKAIDNGVIHQTVEVQSLPLCEHPKV